MLPGIQFKSLNRTKLAATDGKFEGKDTRKLIAMGHEIRLLAKQTLFYINLRVEHSTKVPDMAKNIPLTSTYFYTQLVSFQLPSAPAGSPCVWSRTQTPRRHPR